MATGRPGGSGDESQAAVYNFVDEGNFGKKMLCRWVEVWKSETGYLELGIWILFVICLLVLGILDIP